MANRWNVSGLIASTVVAMHCARAVLLTLVAVSVSACKWSGGSIEGRVLEEGTDRPIPDAVVVATWTGSVSAIVDSQTVCIHVDSTTTDSQGRFNFPRWSKESTFGGVTGIGPDVYAYRAGYEQKKFSSKDVRLSPFSGSPQQRLADFQRKLFGIRPCTRPEKNGRQLIPLYRAFYEEARQIARTKGDQEIVAAITAEIQYVERGYIENAERAGQKEDRQ